MPSCDGSNCSACNCECTKIVYKADTAEIERLNKKIKQLERELAEKPSTEAIMRRIQEELKKNGK